MPGSVVNTQVTLLPVAPTAADAPSSFPLIAHNFFGSIWTAVLKINTNVAGFTFPPTPLATVPHPPADGDGAFVSEADANLAAMPALVSSANGMIDELSLSCAHITALPTPPSRSGNSTGFSSAAATFLAALPTFRTEFNAFINAMNAYTTAASGGGGGGSGSVVSVTGQEFRIRPITAGRSTEPYMRLGGIEFLSGGSMPSGYTAFSSGLGAGTTANLFDGNSGTNAAISTDGNSYAGATYSTSQTIDAVRLNAGLDFLSQYAREWVLEYRTTAGTGSWLLAQRFFSGQFTSNETRTFAVAGDANPLGYRYFKVAIVSNYGSAGTNTYFVELGFVDEDGTTEIQRDFKSATNYGTSMGAAEYLYDGHYSDDIYDLIAGIPANVGVDWGRKKKITKVKIGFRNSPFQDQGPNRIQVYGSNDNFSTSSLLLDTGSNASPTGGEVRTFTIP